MGDSLRTDVPPPSEKNREKRVSSPDFFLSEGGRLYTGYMGDFSKKMSCRLISKEKIPTLTKNIFNGV